MEVQRQQHRLTAIRHHAHPILAPILNPITKAEEEQLQRQFRKGRFQIRCVRPTRRLRLAPMEGEARSHFLLNQETSHGRVHCRRLASTVGGERLPIRRPPGNQRAQSRLQYRHPLPASQVAVERSSVDYSKTTNSMSQSTRRHFRFAPTVAEAPRPRPLHSQKLRVHCRPRLLLPASKVEAEQSRRQVRRWHRPSPGARPMAEAARPLPLH